MRLRLIGLLLLSYFILVGVSQAAISNPVFSMDASTLSPGQITSAIPNPGGAGGSFNVVNEAPIVERIAGKMAVTFDGKNALESTVNAPASMAGEHAWSIATWLYNPTINDEERYCSWTPSGNFGTITIFGYGSNWNWGMYAGGGTHGDMTWGRNPIPKLGQWHHFAYTYSGKEGTLIAYVDGKPISAQSNYWLIPGGPTGSGIGHLRLGSSYAGTYFFSGSMASFAAYGEELSPTDIQALAGVAAPTGPYLFDPSFEYNTGGQSGGNNTWAIFDPQGNPNGAYNGSAGGDTGNGGGWNTGAQGGSGADTGNSGTGVNYTRWVGLGRVMQLGLPQALYFSKYTRENGKGQAELVDGIGMVNMEAGANKYSVTDATKPWQGLNGRTDMVEWSQPVWGMKPGKTYKVWGYFAPTQHLGSGVTKVGYASINIDDKPAFNQQMVYLQNAGDPFQKVVGDFTVPATGAKVFSVLNDGGGKNRNGSQTIAGTSYGEVPGIICDKVGLAEAGSLPAPATVYKYAALGEKFVFFGGVQSDPPTPTSNGGGNTKSATFTISNDGGTDLKITRIWVKGPGNEQFFPAISNNPDSTKPDTFITVPAYGGYKVITMNFAPTRSGVFTPNAILEMQWVDEDGGVHPMKSYEVPLYGYSKAMIYNNSFELPHIANGEASQGNSWYNVPYVPGWTYTKTANSTDNTNEFGVGPFGNYATWRHDTDTGPYITPHDGTGMELKDGSQVGWMRQGGYVQQDVPGFQLRSTYRVVVFASSGRNNTTNYTPWSLKMIKSGSTATSTVIDATTGSKRLPPGFNNQTTRTLYRYEGNFVPSTPGMWTMRIANEAGTDGAAIICVDLVKLYRIGDPAVAFTTTTAINFGEVQKGDLANTRVLCIANDGGSTLTVTAATLSGTNGADFDLVNLQGQPVNFPFTVPPFFQTTNTLVRCKPAAEGAKSALLTVATETGGNLKVNLTADVPSSPYLVNGGMELKAPDYKDIPGRYKMGDPYPLSPDSVNQVFSNCYSVTNYPLGWTPDWALWNMTNSIPVSKADAFMPAIRSSLYDNGRGEGTYVFAVRKTATETTKTIYQWIPGFRMGHTYHVSAKFNARTGANAGGTAVLRLGGTTRATATIAPRPEGAGNYTQAFDMVGCYDTPTTDCQQKLELGIASSNATGELMIDDVKIQEVAPKIAVDQTAVRFPDLVVQKLDGSRYKTADGSNYWFFKPTEIFLRIYNVGDGAGSALHFDPAATNTGHPGLKLAGDAAFKVVSVTPSDTTSDLAAGSYIDVQLRYDPAHGTTAEQNAYFTLAKDIKGTLTITTNDPGNPTLTIPLVANKVPVELGSFDVE